MSGSNCCFLTCIQISQEASKVVWYSHLLRNFPQFVVSHTVKSFNVFNEAEVDIFLELSCSFYNPMDLGSLRSSLYYCFLSSNINISLGVAVGPKSRLWRFNWFSKTLVQLNYWLIRSSQLKYTLIWTSVLCLVTHWGPTLCDPMDCSLPGSSVHGILQARTLEWVAIPFSRGCSWPRDQTQISCFAGRFFTF